ncbi:hypothetical protein EG329_008420 [Mollisiaceae sp. DMI_Dod_QoI]|nr:hypothetical protein EG329_008420 [Helotiales sp. DMI_Dod_QoI]
MRTTTFSTLAVLASSLLVKEVFAAPVQAREVYIDTDIVMVTEEVTVTELADGSYQTGAAVAIGTGTIDGTPVLYTESASATPAATPSTSSIAAPATTSSASSSSFSSQAIFIQKTPATHIHSAASSTPLPSTTSSSVVELPKTTSVASVVTPTTLSTKAASTTPKAVSTTSSAAPIVSSSPVSSSKKRGLAFNDASILSGFLSSSSQVSWAYNWGSTASGLSGLEYIPMLWGLGSDHTNGWSSAASSAIAAGAPALLGFNEPDYSGQANLSPSDAASGWKEYMQPFAGKAKLVSPAVTNGGSPMGLTWIENFISACSGCTIDRVAIHWYNGGDAAAFKSYVQQAYTAGGNRPLWITEFQASGSTDDQNSFLQEVMPFLDSSDMVEKYAYFMASDGILLSAGSALSQLGQTFAEFV